MHADTSGTLQWNFSGSSELLHWFLMFVLGIWLRILFICCCFVGFVAIDHSMMGWDGY